MTAVRQLVWLVTTALRNLSRAAYVAVERRLRRELST
jgi:hypothetical protein